VSWWLSSIVEERRCQASGIVTSPLALAREVPMRSAFDRLPEFFANPALKLAASLAKVSALADAELPPPAAHRLAQLVNRRLDIARIGLAEVRGRIHAGDSANAYLLLDKIDEDLLLLQRRLRAEAEKN
jgi:hypothetical protein